MEVGKKYWFLIKREEERKGSQFIGNVTKIEKLPDGDVRITIDDKFGLEKRFLEKDIKGLEEKGNGKRQRQEE